jgi:hypothetical protein
MQLFDQTNFNTNVGLIGVIVCALLVPSLAKSQSEGILPVPEFYGIYAATNGHLVKLDGKEVRSDRTASVRMGQRQAVSGILNGAPVATSQSASVPVFSADVKIIVYSQSGGITSPLQVAEPLRVEPLVFIRNVFVDTGFPSNVRRTGPENGWEYGNAPELLGLATGDHPEALELLKKPFPGHNDMIIAGFAEKLAPGVYRFTLEPGSGLPGLNDAHYFTFAVEPVADAESAAKCADASVSYAMAVSNVKWRPCGPSARPRPADGTTAAAHPASCDDYQACMKAGNSALASSNWQDALDAYLAAVPKQPLLGEPWVNMGRAYLALGSNDQLTAAWDQVLRLRQDLGIFACHEKVLQPCELGVLYLGAKEISFMVLASRQKIFAGTPTEVSVKKQTNRASQGHVSLTLESNGKTYQLDFVPDGGQCEFGNFLSCQGNGPSQQTVVGNYVSATIPKLASGQFTK